MKTLWFNKKKLNLFEENIEQWPKHVRNLAYISMGLYVLSLGLPIGGLVEGDRSIFGLLVLVFGWLNFVTGSFEVSWFANIALFVSLSNLTVGKPKIAFTFSLIALALATTAIFGDIAHVVYTAGYWCWMSSMLINMCAAFSALLKSRQT